MIHDPYQVLGIREGASTEDIKRAYRKKARECHPDLHPDDPKATEKMQQVNEAYDMLSNPDKYAARQQPRPDSDPYRGAAGYDTRSYGGQSGASRQYRPGAWQYTYYTDFTGANVRNAWTGWQEPRPRDADRQQAGGLMKPFRGLFRFVGGLLLFRLFLTLLRFGLFGFFL